MTLDTRDDRTVFFDLLPMFFEKAGLSFRLSVYTVPGQPMHEITRRLVLKSVDGIAFIADSQRAQQIDNRASYQDLYRNLRGLEITDAPVVLQYNKRDLDDALSDKDLDRFGRSRDEKVFCASAIHGIGVTETFMELVARTWHAVDKNIGLKRTFGIQGDGFLETVQQHIQVAGAPGALTS